MSAHELLRRVAKTRDILVRSGAHCVIDSPVVLPEVIVDIDARPPRGEKP